MYGGIVANDDNAIHSTDNVLDPNSVQKLKKELLSTGPCSTDLSRSFWFSFMNTSADTFDPCSLVSLFLRETNPQDVLIFPFTQRSAVCAGLVGSRISMTLIAEAPMFMSASRRFTSADGG